MRVKESFTYPDTDVESVYALITDPAFREDAVAAVGGQDIEVTIEPSGDGHTVTVIQTQPAKVPDFIKKFVGESVMAKQTETVGRPRRRRQPVGGGQIHRHRPARRHARSGEALRQRRRDLRGRRAS